SPDFSLALDGVPTSSTSGWTLTGARARGEPFDPARPDRTRGVQIVFDYGVDPAGLITLERTYTLRPGAADIGVTSILHNGSPAPLRVGAYSLDELTSPATVSAQVLTYHGGSDWRDDYRVATHETGAFDDEGEVARFDDGRGNGWFFVSERRSGTPSRGGRVRPGLRGERHAAVRRHRRTDHVPPVEPRARHERREPAQPDRRRAGARARELHARRSVAGRRERRVR